MLDRKKTSTHASLCETGACALEDDAAKHPRMKVHIFWSLFGLSMVVLLIVAVTSVFIIQRGYLTIGCQDLERACSMVTVALDESGDPIATAEKLAADVPDMRLTLIAQDGTVLFDSVEKTAAMENHASRPEVREAMETGAGSAIRESSTMLEVALYGAHLLDNGNIVRLSITRDGVLATLTDLAPFVATLVAAMGVASTVVARVLSRRLVAPLDAVDPMHPLRKETDHSAYAEVMPLLRRIEEQHTQIEEQMLRLTDNDRMRVEFTANVTHELKTPLTVISGYAELMAAGIVSPGDVPGFASRIHEEAQHLTALVNDILTLSRMDEAERVDEAYGVLEPVDLREICDSVAERLKARADELGLSITIEGEDRVVALGIPKLVDQIVYNLCDNALRYNRAEGSVTVQCGFDGHASPFVRVSDTGIGIAQENLEKVFNRFFRVDAGRSRETGGTGLGLAIVKHAARCHDAQVHIESTLGKGTEITVTFHSPASMKSSVMPAMASGEVR